MDFVTNAMASLTAKNDSERTYYQLIKDSGYPVESYFYETEDGYINKVIRINGPRDTDASMNLKSGPIHKPVVILQHGLMCSCTDWILNKQNSLAFILAD